MMKIVVKIQMRMMKYNDKNNISESFNDKNLTKTKTLNRNDIDLNLLRN